MYEILNLIGQFGPVIVLAGTFFEGEVFAIIGGFLAYRGSYSLELMAGLAFVGSFFGDLAVFLFARHFTGHRWVRRWRRKTKFVKAIGLVERFQAYFVIVNRYVYGLRMPGLIALGLSNIGVTRFILLNLVGALLWASIFTGVGFVFGYSIQTVFSRLEIMEGAAGLTLLTITVVLAAYFGWRQWGPAFRKRRAGDPDASRQPDDRRDFVKIDSPSLPFRDRGSED